LNVLEDSEAQIVRHKTCRACLEAFLGCPVEKAKAIKGFYQDGSPYRIGAKRFLEMCRHRGWWGFVNNKKTIHFWAGRKASLLGLVRFFAHERGHQMRPYHRFSQEEEIKAGSYEDVAAFALCMAQMVMDGTLKTGEVTHVGRAG